MVILEIALTLYNIISTNICGDYKCYQKVVGVGGGGGINDAMAVFVVAVT